MRDIEDLFKESLKDHELPYNAEAWSKMNEKLDARNSGTSSSIKWFLGAAGVAIIVATYLFVDSNEAPKQIQAEIIQKDQESVASSEEIQLEATEQSETDIVNQEVEKERSVVIIDCCDDIVVQESLNEETYVEPLAETELQQPVYREVAKNPSATEQGTAQLRFSTPNDHCLNQEFSYSNTNKEMIYVLSPEENIEEIAANEKLKLKLDEKGIYQIGTLNQEEEFIASVSFKVHEAQSIQITADDYLNFENGLPELNVQAFSDDALSWYVNNQKVARSGKKENFYLFDKGSYAIKAMIKDANGCQSSDEVSFFVEKNYNLLAVNAFTPNSFDDRNTTFMPFALKTRTTPFTMIVIDPSNGAVIFETTSASQAWQGINKNTGELVKENTSFVWKVILQNPEQGESPEYMGTVVRL
jgi:membrane carboxypeptidase/penicillin-binding protein PbpC